MKKIISLLLCVLLLLAGIVIAFAQNKTQTQTADEIIEVARAEIGYYGDGSNKYNEWYYGVPSDAAWCAVFIGWCADQVGVLNTAVPRKTTCDGMLNWYKDKDEYYHVESGYVPQKGDIVFFDTDNSGISHHVEFVAENGYYTDENGKTCIYTIGGNTSDANYNGEDNVTEHLRDISREKGVVMGFAHPDYETQSSFFMELYAKLLTFFEHVKAFFRELFR